MSNFKIDAVGQYRQHDGGRAEVKFIDGDRAYGRDSTGRSRVWCTNNGSEQDDFPSYSDIVARWPRFAVGDRVRVLLPRGLVQYATITGDSDNSHHMYKVESGSWAAWVAENELVPDDRPDPGPEHRLLGDDEILEAGDERIDGFDPEPRQWLGPLTNTDCLGKTVREVNAEFSDLNILAWRRRLPKSEPQKPFRISDHGPGVYETRDGQELIITERVSEKPEAVHVWCGGLPDGQEDHWTDFGKHNHYVCGDRPLDIVRYIGLLPLSEEPEQWVPTCDYAQQRCDFSDLGAALAFVGNEDGFKYVRHVRKWQCGDKSEWRPIPVGVPK